RDASQERVELCLRPRLRQCGLGGLQGRFQTRDVITTKVRTPTGEPNGCGQLYRLDGETIAAKERGSTGRDGRLALDQIAFVAEVVHYRLRYRVLVEDADGPRLDHDTQFRVVVHLKRPRIGLTGDTVLTQSQRHEEGAEA